MDEHLRYGFPLLSNLPGYYEKADLNGKHRIVGSMFPEKLIFENGQYRTVRLNEVICLLGGKQADFEAKKEGLTIENDNQSYKAPRIGLTSNRSGRPSRPILSCIRS